MVKRRPNNNYLQQYDKKKKTIFHFPISDFHGNSFELSHKKKSNNKYKLNKPIAKPENGIRNVPLFTIHIIIPATAYKQIRDPIHLLIGIIVVPNKCMKNKNTILSYIFLKRNLNALIKKRHLFSFICIFLWIFFFELFN